MQLVRTTGRVLVVMALGIFVGACSSNDDSGSSATATVPTSTVSQAACESPAAATGTPVTATEKDFAISLDTSSAAAGSTSFTVSNDGPSEHEFVVFKTDLAPSDLPLDADGNVDEEGAGVTHVDEIEGIGTGCTSSLTVDLAAGNYVLICNLPGHYQAGMNVGYTAS